MIRINLLKPEKKEVLRAEEEFARAVPKEKEKRVNLLIYSLLIVIVVIGSLFYFLNRAISHEKNLLNQAREEKKQLAHIVKDLEEIQNKKFLIEKKIELVNQLKTEQESPVIMMDELSRNLPDWVWLTSIKYKENRVEIKGKSVSNNLIADYISALEASPYFRNVNLINSTQRRIKREVILEFTLTSDFTYGYEPEVEHASGEEKK
ncbi:MAG: PilN domain-containing protein [Candidatus Aminicenantia bacterium]